MRAAAAPHRPGAADAAPLHSSIATMLVAPLALALPPPPLLEAAPRKLPPPAPAGDFDDRKASKQETGPSAAALAAASPAASERPPPLPATMTVVLRLRRVVVALDAALASALASDAATPAPRQRSTRWRALVSHSAPLDRSNPGCFRVNFPAASAHSTGASGLAQGALTQSCRRRGGGSWSNDFRLCWAAVTHRPPAGPAACPPAAQSSTT
mmetsp:Transcript_74097/g.149292  ORF Transcript_74097/g.149292 Transcript_74097/m.149292 type:complete len:212 (-) Transcript_74097:266-901(-)